MALEDIRNIEITVLRDLEGSIMHEERVQGFVRKELPIYGEENLICAFPLNGSRIRGEELFLLIGEHVTSFFPVVGVFACS